MKAFLEKAKLSLPILGLILGSYGFVLGVAFKTDANQKAVEDLKRDRHVIQQMAIDVAVIKSKVEAIEKKVDR